MIWEDRDWEGARFSSNRKLMNRGSRGGRHRVHCVPAAAGPPGQLCPLPGLAESKGVQGPGSTGAAGLDSQSEGPDGQPVRSSHRCRGPHPPVRVSLLVSGSVCPLTRSRCVPVAPARDTLQGAGDPSVTSEPRAPAPDATSSLRPPQGRRRLRPRRGGSL